MRKIEFENFKEPSLAREILMALQDNIEEAIEARNIMKAYQTSPQIADDYQKVNLHTYESVGELLSFTNGAIKIGKGISSIKVYGQIFFEYLPTNQNYFWIQVRKNNEVIANKLTACPNNEDFITATVENAPISVNEGDLITLNFGDCTNSRPTTRAGKNETFLIVEAIKQHTE